MNAELWECVQDALDQRRDPLTDEGVRAWLLEHPDDALELCELQATLGELERADMPLVLPRRSRLVPLASAAALALAALGAWLALRPGKTSAAEELELHPVVSAPQCGSVLSWQLVSTLETAAGTQTVRASEGRITVEHEYQAPQGAADAALARATILSTHAESWSRP